jgi:predicted helicase
MRRGKEYDFEDASTVAGMYRPFAKQWLYFNRSFNEMCLSDAQAVPDAEAS